MVATGNPAVCIEKNRLERERMNEIEVRRSALNYLVPTRKWYINGCRSGVIVNKVTCCDDEFIGTQGCQLEGLGHAPRLAL
jgi:hypothetical protein